MEPSSRFACFLLLQSDSSLQSHVFQNTGPPVPALAQPSPKASLSEDPFGGGFDRADEEEEEEADVQAKKEKDYAAEYKNFVFKLSEGSIDPPIWDRSGGGGTSASSHPPSDGSSSHNDCTFAFLSRWFGVSCVVGNWIFAMLIILIIAVPLAGIVVAYFKRRLREAEKSTRKPYEELCAFLADVNVSIANCGADPGTKLAFLSCLKFSPLKR